jgi:CheY-like chemotaxis protein
VAKGIIEAHGGSIMANSGGRDAGAIFTVTLLVAEPPRGVSADGGRVENAQSFSPGVERTRVLLVEDHEDTRHALERLLRRWGCEVETAGSVQEGLEKGRVGQFDLLLSDLGLPDGAGTDLMSALGAERGLAGIAMSGFGMDQDIRRSADAGFSEHLTKPVGAGLLKEAIERVRRRSSGA